MENVRSSKLGQNDLSGFCLRRREVGDSMLRRRELGASRPTGIRMVGCFRLRQTELEGTTLGQRELDGYTDTEEDQLLQVARVRARRIQAGTVGARGYRLREGSRRVQSVE